MKICTEKRIEQRYHFTFLHITAIRIDSWLYIFILLSYNIKIVHPYGDSCIIDGKGLENTVLKKRGFFKIVPHLLWHGALVFVVPYYPITYCLLWQTKGTEDLIQPGSSRNSEDLFSTEFPQRWIRGNGIMRWLIY